MYILFSVTDFFDYIGTKWDIFVQFIEDIISWVGSIFDLIGSIWAMITSFISLLPTNFLIITTLGVASLLIVISYKLIRKG